MHTLCTKTKLFKTLPKNITYMPQRQTSTYLVKPVNKCDHLLYCVYIVVFIFASVSTINGQCYPIGIEK